MMNEDENKNDDLDNAEFDDEEEEQDDENKKNENQVELNKPSFFKVIFTNIKTNFFSCEWLDKTEINREMRESHEIGLMESRYDNCIYLYAYNFQRQK